MSDVTKTPRKTQRPGQTAAKASRTKSAKADVTREENKGKGPIIAIDGVEYDASNLSGPAEGALASLRFTEARLMALQSELAVCQTARFAYIKGLREELGLEI